MVLENKTEETDHTTNTCFSNFETDVESIPLPQKFTYPFNYQPHPLCLIAAEEVQTKIAKLPHNFINKGDETNSFGKMFGVLIVQNENKTLGYLAAFSGKLFGGNHFEGFVPPILDTLDPNGFYKKGEEEINLINKAISELENEQTFTDFIFELEVAKKEFEGLLISTKESQKRKKEIRDNKRQQLQNLQEVERLTIEEELNNESSQDQYFLKDLKRFWKSKISLLTETLDIKRQVISRLKEERKAMSAALQQKLFQAYNFLNYTGESKNIMDIFDVANGNVPPSGSGECAAPKLLHYAFSHGFRPIAMAEFWWGEPNISEMRKHGQYYPACKSKCKPILTHMLEGLDVEENPMVHTLATPKELKFVYEDQDIIVVNKPPGLLSVPGKEIKDSVMTRIASLYPDITGPIIVHRLDMSTSGIMILTKNMESYHHIQSQFTKRKVTKRYEAILEAVITQNSGNIDLPLRVDLDNRPRQLVCYTYGKPALTRYEVIARSEKQTLIHFFPITGRTHQLRVHSSHTKGLNCPILGDDLYGKMSDRLYLHAAYIKFNHPRLDKEMEFFVASGFSVEE
jgi:tRNA pseudouridine32 synthase/23S rRNA pseudouridine746 synthase